MLSVKHRSGRKGADQHVTPHPGGGWAVTQHGNGQAISVHRTQKSAVQQARDLARRRGVALVVHGRDGHVRLRVDYGERRDAALLGTADEIIARHRDTYEALAEL